MILWSYKNILPNKRKDNTMAIARDKFWMFGVKPHQDDIWLMPGKPGVKTAHFYFSRITPAEGAFMLDIPNMLMVVCDHEPAPFSVQIRQIQRKRSGFHLRNGAEIPES